MFVQQAANLSDSARLSLQLLTKMTGSLVRKLAEVFRSLGLSAVVAARRELTISTLPLALALAETAHRKSGCDTEDFNSAAESISAPSSTRHGR